MILYEKFGGILMEILPARFTDIREILRIINITMSRNFYMEKDIKTAIKNQKTNLVFCAWENGVMLGYVHVTFRKNSVKFNLDLIVIPPQYQHSGYGQQLLDYTMELMRTTYLKTVCSLQTKANNIKAQKFYLKNGFYKVQEIPQYYYDSSAAVIFEKNLVQPILL